MGVALKENLRASNPRENHNTHSLKENLKEGMQKIESRMKITLPAAFGLF